MRRIAAVTMVVAALAAAGWVAGQEKAAFKDGDRMAAEFDARPRDAIAAVEAVCSQEQLDAIEAALCPALTAEEKLGELEAARKALTRAGMKKDDAIVAALDVLIWEARPAAEAEMALVR